MNNYQLINSFDSSYWSGRQFSVYMGKMHIEEAIQFNYQVFERIQPFYNYSSFVASKIHHGTRLISGELSINFTRYSYLYSLLSALRGQSLINEFIPDNPTSPNSTGVDLPWPIDNNWGASVLAKLRAGGLTADQAIKLDTSAQLKQVTDQIDPINSFTPSTPYNSGLFDVGTCDLTVILGGTIDSSLQLKYISDSDQHYADGAVVDHTPTTSTGTGIKLLDVHLMGVAQSGDDSGRPLIETYSFQARNIRILTAEEFQSFNQSTMALDTAQNITDASLQ